MQNIRRYFREAVETAESASSPREGVWLAWTTKLYALDADEVPESIRGRFEMLRSLVCFDTDDPTGLGIARVTAEARSDEDTRALIREVGAMAETIGALDR